MGRDNRFYSAGGVQFETNIVRDDVENKTGYSIRIGDQTTIWLTGIQLGLLLALIQMELPPALDEQI